ncbi:MAG: alpha/beta hydrolase-fold protein [Faecalibacterium sp.]|nr:alpha/beta hydrolase-fold protein [Ruminococcus sp.]MCM1391336.1 alpha/beta hydrolase-fold protein [Ruminococcus sp.]MCM1484895.1 alpha/beta hydrolase-fold protein [Faecalibacterium sp.]
MEHQSNSKKAIAIVICIVMIFSLYAPATFAANSGVSINAGVDALRAQFSSGKGPKKGNYTIDYSYYSPVKNKNDNQKYPLVVFLPGWGESHRPGEELTDNIACNWSSKEYQARFANAGGAYILIARAREDVTLSWNASALTSPLKAALDDFIKNKSNIDTDRIYVLGWSYGAVGAINQAVSYPNFYAAAVFFAPPAEISSSDAKKLKKMSVWLDVCKNDSFASYNLYSEPSWKNLKNNTADLSKIRLTVYDNAPATGGVLYNHNTWLDAFYDMHSSDSRYKGRTTSDGNGNKIDVSKSGMISWLSEQSLKKANSANTSNSDGCPCLCHSSNSVTRLFWKLQVFFWRIFGISNERPCECGILHW